MGLYMIKRKIFLQLMVSFQRKPELIATPFHFTVAQVLSLARDR